MTLPDAQNTRNAWGWKKEGDELFEKGYFEGADPEI